MWRISVGKKGKKIPDTKVLYWISSSPDICSTSLCNPGFWTPFFSLPFRAQVFPTLHTLLYVNFCTLSFSTSFKLPHFSRKLKTNIYSLLTGDSECLSCTHNRRALVCSLPSHWGLPFLRDNAALVKMPLNIWSLPNKTPCLKSQAKQVSLLLDNT